MSMAAFLETLCGTYGVAGREDAIAQVITERIAPYVDEIRRDAMGNLIAFKKGQGKGRLMVAAHMDEIGLMVTHIDDKGFLRVCEVGVVSPERAVFRHVEFENGVRGTVGVEIKTVKEKSNPTMNQLYIDIGATTKEEAEARVPVGSSARFLSDFLMMDGRASCTAMDNRSTCVVLAEALRRIGDTPQDIYAVFTCQEEMRLRGAFPAAYALEPDVAIALDITPSGDTPEGHPFNTALGKGPTVKVMDGMVICHPKVIRWLEKAAEQAGIQTQREVVNYGGTDTAAIQSSRRGVPSGAISVPVRYLHSPSETVDIADMEGTVDLLTQAMTMGYEGEE